MKLVALLLLILSACAANIGRKPDSQLLHQEGYGDIVFKGLELPLMVYNFDPLLESSTLDAVEAWNGWMGVEFLSITTDSAKGEIFIFGGESDRYNGITQFIAVPIHQRGVYRSDHLAKITMFNGSTETLVHEIGHAVGLAHDPENRRSIMHPYSMPRYMPVLEKRDIAALKRIYLR